DRRKDFAAAGGEELEVGVADAEAETGGGVLRVVTGDAAVDEQAAERDNEGLHLHAGDQPAGDGAEQTAADDDADEGERPGNVVVDDEVDEDRTEQRYQRADRQFDAAGDDDESLADGKDAEQADLVGGVRDVGGEEEALI